MGSSEVMSEELMEEYTKVIHDYSRLRLAAKALVESAIEDPHDCGMRKVHAMVVNDLRKLL